MKINLQNDLNKLINHLYFCLNLIKIIIFEYNYMIIPLYHLAPSSEYSN